MFVSIRPIRFSNINHSATRAYGVYRYLCVHNIDKQYYVKNTFEIVGI